MKCSQIQIMYQELSKKVDKISYKAAMDLTITHYDECKSTEAWDPANVSVYQRCTNEISKSSSKIHVNLNKIEIYCMHRKRDMSIQVELEQILEDVELDPDTTNSIDLVLSYIGNIPPRSSKNLSCSEVEGMYDQF